METILILAVILLVAAIFRWLARLLADEGPPALEPRVPIETIGPIETVAPITTIAPIETVAPTLIPSPPARMSLPEEGFALETEVIAVAGQELAAINAPEMSIIPLAPLPSGDSAPVIEQPAGIMPGRIAWAMIVGGGLLALLAQVVGKVMPDGERLPTGTLFLVGGTVLLVGIRSFMRGGPPGRIGRLLGRVAGQLGVTQGQVVLLLLALPFAWLVRLAAGDGLLARQPVAAVLAWLLAIAFAVGGSVERGTRRPLVVERWDIVLSVLLFGVALALRAYRTDLFPNTYSGDEGAAGLFAVEWLSGRANNLFSLGWFSFPSLYFTVQSAAIALFGQTVEAVRLTSAVAGALTVLALYWLARTMFNRTTAILAAGYLAASHYHIHMSRIALNNVWDGLFGTVAILGLWYGWKSGRRLGFIICGLALGLGQYFYVSIRMLPILFLIWAAAAFWRQRALFRERFTGLALAAFIALVVFLPLGLYFANHTDEFQAPMNRVTIFGDWLEGELARGEQTTAEIIVGQAVKGAMGFTHEPLRLLYDPGSPLLLSGAGILFLLGILVALLNFDLRYLLLMLPLLAAVAANAVSQGAPASQRYVMAMPLVALFIALPITQSIVWLRAHYPKTRVAAVVVGFGLMALIAAVDLNFYFNKVYDSYTLGGLNTQVATQVAYYLRDKEPADEQVYFFGFPRMGYFSLSTIPFLAAEKRAQDVIEPLTGPPNFVLSEPTLFIFLPERLNELEFVRRQYPGGAYHEFHSEDGELLFAVYES